MLTIRARTHAGIFGGANGNEGLGVLSLCFDWNYIGSGGGSLGALCRFHLHPLQITMLTLSARSYSIQHSSQPIRRSCILHYRFQRILRYECLEREYFT